MAKNSPVWLIGLDGASFDILQPMIDSGRLPVIEDMIKAGASAKLVSNVAPITPQAWASVITGTNPGRHGVFGFVREMPGCPPEFLSSRSINGERLWTRFGRAGLKSLIINVPLTYPPEPLNGVMVTGMMTPSKEKQFTYPSALRTRILSEFQDYELDVRGGIDYSRNLEVLDKFDSILTARAELVMRLIKEEEPDFLFVVFVLPDRIQHTYCQYIHPESPLYDSAIAKMWRPRIWDSYARLDTIIGRLMEVGPPGKNSVLISDHGFTIERGGFFTNDFLASLGLLSLKTGSGRGAARSVIRRLNVAALKRFVPRRLFVGTVNFTKESIDWSQTAAYASPIAQQGIFINETGRQPAGIVGRRDYENIRGRIVEAINSLKDPGTGRPLIRAHRREALFSGPFLDCIPDIVLEPESGLEAKDAILGGDFLTRSKNPRGIHHRDGIFIGRGPAISTGRFEGLVLEDIAQNILALAGIEPPADLDGVIRSDIFDTRHRQPAMKNGRAET